MAPSKPEFKHIVLHGVLKMVLGFECVMIMFLGYGCLISKPAHAFCIANSVEIRMFGISGKLSSRAIF